MNVHYQDYQGKWTFLTFPHQARKVHILHGLVHNSRISVGQLCASGCDVTFTREKEEVTKDEKCVMSGLHHTQSRLWKVNLNKSMKLARNAECSRAHDNSIHKELINYLHAACFSPVKSTWIQAIKNGNFTSWSRLTEKAVDKHLSKSTATVKGRMNQQRVHARSTQIKKEEDCKIEAKTALGSGLKTHYVYAATVDAGQIYTYQTGRFTAVSSRGNTYIMVLYEYDDNAIMAEPIKMEQQENFSGHSSHGT
jgi:hypothetical protein